MIKVKVNSEVLKWAREEADYEIDNIDPYLIAMILNLKRDSIDFGYEYVLVTNEKVGSPNKLPAVCKRYGIKHMNIFQFFEANGFEFHVDKR